MYTDPVCGMQLKDDQVAVVVAHEGTTYGFCSETCSVQFSADPDEFIGHGRDKVVDPVCGMTFMRHQTPFHRVHKDKTYRFCSQECYHRFVLDPDQYAYPGEVA